MTDDTPQVPFSVKNGRRLAGRFGDFQGTIGVQETPNFTKVAFRWTRRGSPVEAGETGFIGRDEYRVVDARVSDEVKGVQMGIRFVELLLQRL